VRELRAEHDVIRWHRLSVASRGDDDGFAGGRPETRAVDVARLFRIARERQGDELAVWRRADPISRVAVEQLDGREGALRRAQLNLDDVRCPTAANEHVHAAHLGQQVLLDLGQERCDRLRMRRRDVGALAGIGDQVEEPLLVGRRREDELLGRQPEGFLLVARKEELGERGTRSRVDLLAAHERHQADAVEPLGHVEAERVEQRRHDVHRAHLAVDRRARRFAGQPHHERDTQQLVVERVTVPHGATLEELLAVVGGQQDGCPVQHAVRGQLVEEVADEPIGVVDLAVVQVDDALAVRVRQVGRRRVGEHHADLSRVAGIDERRRVLRRRRIRRVRVDDVDEHEEPFLRVIVEPYRRGLRGVAGRPERCGRMIEALVQAEVGPDESVADERRRGVARLLEMGRQRRVARVEPTALEARALPRPMVRRQQAREDRREPRQRPRRRRDGRSEDDAFASERVDPRARRTLIPVGTQMIGAQRVDADHQEVGRVRLRTRSHEQEAEEYDDAHRGDPDPSMIDTPTGSPQTRRGCAALTGRQRDETAV
jgi:hypothetical protein